MEKKEVRNILKHINSFWYYWVKFRYEDIDWSEIKKTFLSEQRKFQNHFSSEVNPSRIANLIRSAKLSSSSLVIIFLRWVSIVFTLTFR